MNLVVLIIALMLSMKPKCYNLKVWYLRVKTVLESNWMMLTKPSVTMSEFVCFVSMCRVVLVNQLLVIL